MCLYGQLVPYTYKIIVCCGEFLSLTTEFKASGGFKSHLHLLNLCVFVEELLHLCRVNVFPSTDDHILHASFNATVSETVEAGCVAVQKNIVNKPFSPLAQACPFKLGAQGSFEEQS